MAQMAQMGSTGMLALLVFLACSLTISCRRSSDQTAVAWVVDTNAYATHVAILGSGEARRIIVLGHGGVGDTVTDFVLEGPLERIAIISTTHAAFISALGLTDRVIACAHAKDVRDADLRAAIDKGRVKDIGTADGVDREALLALKPDAVLGYPFGGEGSTLESLGIPVIQVSEYLEEHPLGRAEWIRFFGALLGKEHEADSIFDGIVERYEVVRKSVPRDSMPTVLFGSVWQGQWWVPPGNSYMAKLIEDAGGRYLFADRKGTGNIAVDMETMIEVGSQADFWGMIAEVRGPVDARTFTTGDTRLSSFRSVREGRLILGNTANEDLFGRALLEPDHLLWILREYFDIGTINRSTVYDHELGYRPRYFAGMYQEPPLPKMDILDFTHQ